MADKNVGERTIIITEKVTLEDKNAPNYEPFLIQISGRETGQMFNLKGRVVRLGRDRSCQIVLDDQHVSRQHAEIAFRNDGEIAIRDLGSTNGVFVNGTRVQEQSLMEGDKILIGTRLYFKFCYQDSVDQSYQQNLFRAANIDGLTQLYNKKYFIDALSKEFSFSRRNGQPLSLIMMDIDHFKQINDTYGHMAGDKVLKTLGTYLQSHLRLENVACRYGGEEFSVILRNVNQDLALFIAERLRKEIEREEIVYQEKSLRLTVSIGIATLESSNFETIEDLIRQADEYLYQAKQSGRNRTILAKAA